MTKAKTSTFIIDHDRCDPAAWTPENVLALSKFIRFGGDFRYAAALSRLGLRLVQSDFYEQKGGDMAQVGWSKPEWLSRDAGEYVEMVEDLEPEDDVSPIIPIYAGPLQYAYRIPIGNEAGEVDGYEVDIVEDQAKAEALVKSYYAPTGDE